MDEQLVVGVDEQDPWHCLWMNRTPIDRAGWGWMNKTPIDRVGWGWMNRTPWRAG